MKNLFKIILLFSIAAVFVMSCSEKSDTNGGVGEKALVLTFDKNVILSNGSDQVTFTAYYKGEDVTSASVIYKVEGAKYEPINGNTFSTTTADEYSFQVGYQTAKSGFYKINAIDNQIPSALEDPQPNGTAFVKRAFLNQYTGAGCGNCPYMIKLLKRAFYHYDENNEIYLMDEEWEDKIVLAAIRNYSGENGFAEGFGTPPGGWPHLQIDYSESYSHGNSAEGLQERVTAITSAPAKAGISASTKYYSDDCQVVVRVTVKAAEAGEYNVGAWLMQDQYYSLQKDDHNIIGSDKSYHYHDNSVRLADSFYLNSHVGYPLGRLERGQTADWVFVMNINPLWWEKNGSIENIHLAAFVTTPTVNKNGKTEYVVVNAIDFKYNESYPYDYISE